MADLNLDARVLESYIEGFYGHGSYEAKYWFIGMEFGGGGSLAEVVSRIQGWYDRGGKELEDLGPNGVGAGSRWFKPPYPLQRTWVKLIRVLLCAEAINPTNEAMRAYQRDKLGRTGGVDCILELLPLPSPRLNRWQFYPQFATQYPQLSYLDNRPAYTSHVAPRRMAVLRERIYRHKPRAVVFYGTGYVHWWRQIAAVDFQPVSTGKVWTGQNADTTFVIMQHPTARGLPNSYFEAVGSLIGGTLLP